MFLAAIAASIYGVWMYWPFGMHRLFSRGPNPGLGLVRATIALSALWFYYIFVTGAASDIVGYYVWFYVFFAYACLLIGSFWRPILDVYHRGDVIERQNLAAGIVLAGFAAGTAFAFGGALTGDGPGWIVVLVFFLLAYVELRAALATVSRISGDLAKAVRQEHDVSAAVLLAGVALGAGLISGRAAAGDFLGWKHALADYSARLWPILAVPIVAALVGFMTRAATRRLFARGATSVALTLFGGYFYLLT